MPDPQNEKKLHMCRETEHFDVFMAGYPHAIYRCGECKNAIRSKAIDDLDDKELELALDMMAEFKKKKLTEGEDHGATGEDWSST